MGNNFITELSKILDPKYILTDVLMKKHTTFKIGGTADVMVMPVNENQISTVVDFCKKKDIPWIIIGRGSNLLVSDKGIRGIIIKIGDNFSNIKKLDDKLIVKAGASMSSVAQLALKYELTGLEFASGIPGTLGGGIYMNAGAYDGEISQIIISSRYMDTDGNIQELKGDEHDFSYRHSVYQKNAGIILSCVLQLRKGVYSDIQGKMKELNNSRRDKQPLDMPSAGSVFKRPTGNYATKLIDECGLKGYTIGGAMVSNKHCGFIVNTGNATCTDVLSLIEHIKDIVYKNTGIELNTEIKIIGEF